MPVYEYACPACGHAFDALVSLHKRTNPQPCPECNADTTRKVSLFGFKTKGGTKSFVSSSTSSCSSCSSSSCSPT